MDPYVESCWGVILRINRCGVGQLKFITRDERGAYHLDAYMAYLASPECRLPPGANRFATQDWKYDLRHSQCFHDSWLEKLIIEEMNSASISGSRIVNLTATFLGPMHDGMFELNYQNVMAYELTGNFARSTQSGSHGDLIVDEIVTNPDGGIRHEMIFTFAVLLIKAADVAYIWRPVR